MGAYRPLSDSPMFRRAGGLSPRSPAFDSSCLRPHPHVTQILRLAGPQSGAETDITMVRSQVVIQAGQQRVDAEPAIAVRLDGLTEGALIPVRLLFRAE